jgi:hypothetical protein
MESTGNICVYFDGEADFKAVTCKVEEKAF